jgi:hypothetical protein
MKREHSKRFDLAVGFTLMICLLTFATASAQPCDTELDSPVGDPYGYQWRDNRCEGRYIQKVGSSVLTVASLTQVFPESSSQLSKKLRLTWAVQDPQQVQLRAQSLRHRFYYRMDAEVPPGTTQFIWPTDLLTSVGLTRADMGLVARTRWRLGETEHTVYLPLRVWPYEQEEPESGERYELILRPGAEVEEVYLSIASLDSAGTAQAYFMDGQPLGYGYYPTGRPIKIPIATLPAVGLFRLELGAVLRDGGTATLTLTLYHTQ